jgi:hypothetical protein
LSQEDLEFETSLGYTVKPFLKKTLKFHKAVGNTLEQIGIGNDFLDRAQKAQHLRKTMNKWNFIRLKGFCTAKETVTRLKR